MYVGPRREYGESPRRFYRRSLKYACSWMLGLAPVFTLSVFALKQGMGDGPSWKLMVFLAMLSGFALAMATLAACAFAVREGWAWLCERSPSLGPRWERAKFLCATLILVPIWGWMAYTAVRALVMHEIMTPSRRHSRLVTYGDEPAVFIGSLAFHMLFVFLIPWYWARWNRQPSTHAEDTTTLPPT